MSNQLFYKLSLLSYLRFEAQSIEDAHGLQYESISRTLVEAASGAIQGCTDGRATRAGRTSTVQQLSSYLISSQFPFTPQILSDNDTKVVGDIYTSISNNNSTILFDPVVKKGIVKFEVQSIEDLSAVGIADETVKYERREYPQARGYEKIVEYKQLGYIEHIGDHIEGNAGFENAGDRVTLEMNMDSSPRTLTFFKNDVEQPNYVTNIPAAVRASLPSLDNAFKVLKFEALPAPTAKHAAGSRSWEYGTEWEI
ncbi:MAG: hypothetical protein EZS28_036928 [Streblomastix strix]|uniref:Uncharacterized protein n=2 Tax=Streblomastix strix TaxID=222440 RepID=A0A5J4UD80_9EUKA|nr:MAG: hypothetical protein EZS28_036928 [Streblomastix strix]